MVQARKYTFPREERIRGTALINALFTRGRTFTSYPFKVFWDFAGTDGHRSRVRAGFSVPKKNFRRAVDRNLIKRRMREAYRQNKHILRDRLTGTERPLVLMILYLPKKIIGYHELQAGIKRLIDMLCQTLDEANE
jgi:ribonuclease P protein component